MLLREAGLLRAHVSFLPRLPGPGLSAACSQGGGRKARDSPLLMRGIIPPLQVGNQRRGRLDNLPGSSVAVPAF